MPAWRRITVTSGAEGYDLCGMPGPDGTAYRGLPSTSTIVPGASITYAVALEHPTRGVPEWMRRGDGDPEQPPSQPESLYHARPP